MTTALTRRRREFGENVALDAVEDLLHDHDPAEAAQTEWVLGFSRCRHMDPGAGFRLGNGLRLLRRGRVIVEVPDSHVAAKEWFQVFTRSGLGLALAHHADQVCAAGEDVTQAIRDYYTERGERSSTNYAVTVGIHDGALVPTKERFASDLLKMIQRWLPTASADLSRTQFQSAARLGYEAVCNVVDHAFKSPWSHDEPLSYLSVRWHLTLSAKEARLGGLREYLEAHGSSHTPEDEPRGWMELVVCDDGNGIPARFTEDPDIYTGRTDQEDEALMTALQSAQTVKLAAQDAVVRADPGYGMTIIVDALRRSGSYAAIRTGRSLVEFDPYAAADGFALRGQKLGFMPGTALHVLLPVVSRQLRLA